MKFNALAQKAAKGSAPAAYGGALEVELLIAFALEHGAAGADEIERLCALHGWLEDGLLPMAVAWCRSRDGRPPARRTRATVLPDCAPCWPIR